MAEETKKTKNQKYLNLPNVVYLGFLFLVGYIPFMTVQNLITEIEKANHFDSLGFQLLAVLYLFQMIGAILGASIASKIGMKLTFGIGFVCLSMMVFCQILTAWRAQKNQKDNQDGSSFLTSKAFVIPTLFICHIISGFGQAIIWIAQGEYISECGTEETHGFFFALFWAFYMAS